MKLSPQQNWKIAYANARLTSRLDTDRRFTHPAFDRALKCVWGGFDILAARPTGKYLEMLRYKNRVIASGDFWPGFRPPIFNCRCAPVPVVLELSQ